MPYPCSLSVLFTALVSNAIALAQSLAFLYGVGLLRGSGTQGISRNSSAGLPLQRWDPSLTAESTHPQTHTPPATVCAHSSYTSWQFSITSAHSISAHHSQTPSWVHLEWLGHRNTSQYTHWHIAFWLLSYLQRLVDPTHTHLVCPPFFHQPQSLQKYCTVKKIIINNNNTFNKIIAFVSRSCKKKKNIFVSML